MQWSELFYSVYQVSDLREGQFNQLIKVFGANFRPKNDFIMGQSDNLDRYNVHQSD